MILTLYKFRKFERASFNFQENKVNLLSGDSGSGKTTILEALRWVLYGGSGKSVYPYSTTSKSRDPTRVTLELEDERIIKVERSIPPDMCIVTLSTGEQLEGDSAASAIHSYFGDATLFFSTSYIPQNERNAFLSSNVSSRFEILEKLIFDGEDTPDEILTKIEDSLKTERKNLELECASLRQKEEASLSLAEKIELYPGDEDEIEKDLSSIALTLEKREKEITRLSHETSLSLQRVTLLNERLLLLPPSEDVTEDEKELSKKLEVLKKKLREAVKEETSLRHLQKEKEKALTFFKGREEWLSLSFSDESEMREVVSSLIEFHLLPPEEENPPFSEVGELSSPEAGELSSPEDEKSITQSLERIKKIKKNLPLRFTKGMLSFDYSLISLFRECLPHFGRSLRSVTTPEKEIYESVMKEIPLLQKREKWDKKITEYSSLFNEKDELCLISKIQEFISFKKTREEYFSSLSLLQKEEASLLLLAESKEKEKRTIPEQLLHSSSFTTSKKYVCPECKCEVILIDEVLQKSEEIYISPENLKKIEKVNALEKQIRQKQEITDRLQLRVTSLKNILPDWVISISPPENLEEEIHHLREVATLSLSSLPEKIKIAEEIGEKMKETLLLKKMAVFEWMTSEDIEGVASLTKTLFYSEREKFLALQQYNYVVGEEEKEEELLRKKEKLLLREKKKNLLQKIGKYPLLKIEKKDSERLILNYFLVATPLPISPVPSSEELSGSIESVEKKINFVKINKEKELILRSLSSEKGKEELLSFHSSLISENSEIKKQLENTKRLIPMKARIDELYPLQISIEECKDKILYLQNKIDDLEELKKVTLSHRGECLHSFVRSVVTITNKVLSSIFENEILFDIELTKATSRKIEGKLLHKPSVVFKISHKNVDFDGIECLSGGEKDRISLAISIALSLSTNSKFLILDEVVSSLDEEMREKCVTTLKKYCFGKTIINVCHSVVEAHHDSVTEL